MKITQLKVNDIDQFYKEIENENISTYGDLCNKVNKNSIDIMIIDLINRLVSKCDDDIKYFLYHTKNTLIDFIRENHREYLDDFMNTPMDEMNNRIYEGYEFSGGQGDLEIDIIDEVNEFLDQLRSEKYCDETFESYQPLDNVFSKCNFDINSIDTTSIELLIEMVCSLYDSYLIHFKMDEIDFMYYIYNQYSINDSDYESNSRI